jgi:F-type H+-transporting ATPase subunit b
MQIISNIALISINETLIIQLISFLIFLFIINRVMIQPLRGVVQERENHIQNIQDDAKDADKEIERLMKRLKKQEAEVIREAHAIREQIEVSGKQQADGIVESAQKEVDKLSQENQRLVSALVSEARQSIQKEAESLSVGMMEKLLERRLTP